MTDYIKREDAKNMMRKFRGYYDEDAIAKFEIALGAGYIPPNEDVVEVVRCKDCKKYNTDDCMMIHGKKMNRNIFANDYCSYGERTEE